MKNPFIQDNRPLVFISHSSDNDKEIVLALQRWIKLAYESRIRVFVSSTDGIAPDQMPSKAIDENLEQTDILIVLLSPNAKAHDWLSYEVGRITSRKKMVFALLCNGAKIDSVPSPITAMNQIKDAADPEHFFMLVKTIDEITNMRVSTEYETLRHILCENALTTRMPSQFKLLYGTGIKVNATNNAPICPTCANNGVINYLFFSTNTSYDGGTSTKFDCLQKDCNFEYTFYHEKPWQEMLVDL